ERGFIENLAIYEDYGTAAIEAELRTYLLKDHLAAGARFGVDPVRSDAQLKALAAAGKLVEAPNTPESLFYYYNVSKQYRFFTPGARAGLEALGGRLQEIIRRSVPDAPVVKFAVSSALRPVAYQQRLRLSNANASFQSSHRRR
ncbi:MAG: DUF5715 family protein, partial [Bacteroidota bacterium]